MTEKEMRERFARVRSIVVAVAKGRAPTDEETVILVDDGLLILEEFVMAICAAAWKKT